MGRNLSTSTPRFTAAIARIRALFRRDDASVRQEMARICIEAARLYEALGREAQAAHYRRKARELTTQ